ncbi:hypothetical protein V6N11_048446 [Hibiscus sabdariffa]|uniref:Pectinesterase inhibitor domain-containing protein n=1 Tax=Hibiscus sabdariffa TaxID=183260 RepID=A0ABR2PV75_9ROSI
MGFSKVLFKFLILDLALAMVAADSTTLHEACSKSSILAIEHLSKTRSCATNLAGPTMAVKAVDQLLYYANI